MSTELPPLFELTKGPAHAEPFSVLRAESMTPSSRIVAWYAVREWDDPALREAELQHVARGMLRALRMTAWKKHGLQYVI